MVIHPIVTGASVTITNFQLDSFDVHLNSRVPHYVATVHLTFSPD